MVMAGRLANMKAVWVCAATFFALNMVIWTPVVFRYGSVLTSPRLHKHSVRTGPSNYSSMYSTRQEQDAESQPETKLDIDLITTSGIKKCIVNRFRDSAWESNPIFNTMKELQQSYRFEGNGMNGTGNMEHSASKYTPAYTHECVFTDHPVIQKKIADLEQTVQQRFRTVQNPADCASAKKVAFTLRNSNGFGSNLHQVVYGMLFAYATGRTMVLNPTAMAYGRGAWEHFMLPLSDTCLNTSGEAIHSAGEYTEELAATQVVDLGGPSFKYIPSFIPPTIPSDILESLKGIHCDPVGWWIGQIVKFVFRPTPEIEEEYERMASNMSYASPIVAIHIRKTDKLKGDAESHSVDEYMRYADEYYERLEKTQTVRERKVFVATDDVMTIKEIAKRYPHYTVLGNTEIAQSAQEKKSFDTLKGIILDLLFLARSDFLVCTFSSNVCRAAYEIMQSRFANASENVRSLDCHHFLYKIYQLPRIATENHSPPGETEISFNAGDLIQSYGELYNGLSIGQNLNSSSRMVGYYPSKKALRVIVPINVPVKPVA